MNKIEKEFLNKALNSIDIFPEEAKIYLNALQYNFKSKYSYYFYSYLCQQPLEFKIRYYDFYDKMKCTESNIDAVIGKLKSAYDLEFIREGNNLKFTVWKVINRNIDYNSAVFDVTYKIAGRVKTIKYGQKFNMSFDSLCNIFNCKKYTYGLVKQNVLALLKNDFYYDYEVCDKDGKSVKSLELSVSGIRAEKNI